MNSIFTRLNYSFLSEYSKRFTDLRDVLYIMNLAQSKDGHSYPTDKELLAIEAEMSIGSGFFQSKNKVVNFVYSLEPNLQNSIKARIGEDIESVTLETLISVLIEYGLPLHLALKTSRHDSNSPSVLKFKADPNPFKPLKPYQAMVVQRANELLKPNFSRCIIQMPTGSGKTRTAIELVINNIRDNKDVLWIANSEELINQAFTTFCDSWSHLANLESTAVNYLTAEIPNIEFGPIFHATTIQSLLDIQSRTAQALASRTTELGLVVFDEAHQAPAPRYREVLERYTSNPKTKLLGLTATPGRSFNQVQENVAFAELFHGNIVRIEPPSANMTTMDYLRSEGVLSYVKQHIVENEWLEIDSLEIEESLNTLPDLNYELLSRIGKNAERNYLIIKTLTRLIEDGKSVLYFAPSVHQSLLVTTILAHKGIQAAHIDGSTLNRAHIIRKFHSGEIRILSNFGVLHTGFDAPGTDVVFIGRPTKSIILYSQMIGRGLRGPSVGGKEYCELYTVQDNIKGLISNDEIASYFDDYFSNNR